MDLSAHFNQPVERVQKLSSRVAQRLMEMITSGELKPGDQLPPERVLCESFQIGRTSLREAMAALEFVGVIDTQQGRGTVVQSVDVAADTQYEAMLLLMKEESPQEILYARRAIEAETASIASLKRTSDDLQLIKNYLDEMNEQLADNRVFSMESDRNFHLAIANASHTRILNSLARMVLNLTRQNLWTTMRNHTHLFPELPQKYTEQHFALFDAIKGSRPEEARRVMMEHLDAVKYDIFDREENHGGT